MRISLLCLLLLLSLLPLAAEADDLGGPSWRRYEPAERTLGALFKPHGKPGLQAPGTDRDMHRLLQRARQLVGTPYRWGGTSAQTGFDCSGLLVYLFRKEVGVELPRTTGSMIRQSHRRVPRHALKPGDAVFFSQNGSERISHVGLYLGDSRFIHAPRTGKTVRIDSLANSYWDRNFTTARRFRH
ncbi:C40 family peptidase [Pseudomonas citronellolis]|uniref:C40 family peptidase n=1 Tax=Pseudomonas citronellolis TaxID=53408 RepID=UPI0023E3A4EA|nr:C40 family peptidase [Pseudomonas citronellolis]MDF3932355.1 C40 family peptidase [Pseudomonas citronellolis]